ncbi:DUF6215 domain-containing protein [Streptomyces sp. NPDC008121]|uniref:DUF6215 domain-containing protein n=1 Tax=Streptomyces sp. NPDC008121 TaxID=3364809 RepID=UPI0036E1891A
MAEDIDALPRGAGAWGQAVMAVALVAVMGLALVLQDMWASSTAGTPAARPATCPDEEPGKTADGTSGAVARKTGKAEAEVQGKAPRPLTGARLCEALHRPDLAALLGVPGETAKSAEGADESFDFLGTDAIAHPSARVEFETYTVTLAATYDGAPVAGSVGGLGQGAQERTVLGRPAVLFWDHTMRITFRLDGSDADSGPGLPVGVLTVAQDARDSGGSFEVALWRSDGGVPSDAVLTRVAEKVLPTVPGWAARP